MPLSPLLSRSTANTELAKPVLWTSLPTGSNHQIYTISSDGYLWYGYIPSTAADKHTWVKISTHRLPDGIPHKAQVCTRGHLVALWNSTAILVCRTTITGRVLNTLPPYQNTQAPERTAPWQAPTFSDSGRYVAIPTTNSVAILAIDGARGVLVPLSVPLTAIGHPDGIVSARYDEARGLLLVTTNNRHHLSFTVHQHSIPTLS